MRETKALRTAGTETDMVREIEASISRNPMHREIYLKTIRFCEMRENLGAVESEIADYPEFAYAAQTPYALIMHLVTCGALVQIPLDEEGREVTSERAAGLSEDELDDLVADYALEATEAGTAATDALRPENRLGKMVRTHADVEDELLDLLEFCERPRQLAEIDAELRRLEGEGAGHDPRTAGVLIDLLERAGGVCWHDSWETTSTGRRFARACRDAGQGRQADQTVAHAESHRL